MAKFSKLECPADHQTTDKGDFRYHKNRNSFQLEIETGFRSSLLPWGWRFSRWALGPPASESLLESRISHFPQGLHN